jgi:hypothetical protein
MEREIHKAIVRYLKLQYPNVMFHTDLAGQWVPKSQLRTISLQKGQPGFPDLVIYEPRGQYQAFFLEIKKTTPFLKDGSTLKKDEHLANQDKWHDALRKCGMVGGFVVGFDKAKELIDRYLIHGF